MPVHMLHMITMYVPSLCLKTVCVCVCVKYWTGLEAIEVETLTRNNVAGPRLPASERGNEHRAVFAVKAP